jgi:hypothetical protein
MCRVAIRPSTTSSTMAPTSASPTHPSTAGAPLTSANDVVPPYRARVVPAVLDR